MVAEAMAGARQGQGFRENSVAWEKHQAGELGRRSDPAHRRRANHPTAVFRKRREDHKREGTRAFDT